MRLCAQTTSGSVLTWYRVERGQGFVQVEQDTRHTVPSDRMRDVRTRIGRLRDYTSVALFDLKTPC